jgi:Flp pilus assembly protein TadD
LAEGRRLAARGARPVRATTNASELSSTELSEALAAARASPTSSTVHRAAAALLAHGVRDQAFDQYTDALRIDKRDAAAHDGLARIWRDWGWPVQAMTAAHLATYYSPHSSEAWNTLGTILEGRRERDDARAAYEKSLALDTGAWWAQANLCSLDAAYAPADAELHCRRALELNPALHSVTKVLRDLERRREEATHAAHGVDTTTKERRDHR